ncbi:MAG TPA: Vms1/Ankzf1 family peptidyl-tRNA hydrolase [Bryobacteraceae bacterium]|jgi:peptide subunit release factor 1 (eRF1)
MSSTITDELVTTIEEPLARLVAFEPTTFPVLSVYLNTQPDQHGRDPDAAPYLQREFKALARTWAPSSPERQSFDRDTDRILSYVTDKIDSAANGVAIFACWGAEEFFEAIQLTTPVSDNRVYAYNQPHLYQLARLDDLYPRYAAVLTDTHTARIFVFGLGQVIDAEEVKGKKVHRVKVGGWSQARYQRRVGNAHQEHAKEVMEHLAQIVREDHVSHIVLAGDSVVIPLLQEQLPQEMVPMVEVMKLDIHASDQDVMAATLEKLQEQETSTAAEKVDRLMNQYRARGLAVVGLHETLEALANGQVEELLISGALEESHPQQEEVEAILAPEIPDAEGGTESDEPRQASLPDLLVTKAKQTGATITFIEDPALLESTGGVGAFLRWRAIQ